MGKAIASLRVLFLGLLMSLALNVRSQHVDTVKILNAIDRADRLISAGSYDLAYKVADSLRIVAKNKNLQNVYAITLNRIGAILRGKGDLSHSISFLSQSASIADSLKDKELVSHNYNNLGAVNRLLGNYPVALTYYLKSLKINEDLNDLGGISSVYNNIGIVYLYQEDYAKALEYYGRSQVISMKTNDLSGQSISYINIGEVYQKMGNNADAIACYLKGLKLSEKLEDRDSQAVISNELGNIYKHKGDLLQANNFYLKALLVFEHLGDKYRIAQVLISLGDCNLGLKRIGKAHRLLTRAYALSHEVGSWELIRDVSFSLSKYYQVNGQYREALLYHQRYTAARDSSFSKGKTEQLIRSQMRFDFEKEQGKIKAEEEKRLVIAAEKIRWQRTVRIMLSLVVVALLALLAVLFRNYRNKQALFKLLEENQVEIVEKNEELIQQQEEILAQRDEIEKKNIVLEEHQREIEEQNERIMSSLEYAKTIQEAILPEEEFFATNFKDYFVIYNPKDVVSGDFYWTYEFEDTLFVALADCTGHGVPGGFMSMVGNMLLNQVVVEWQIKDPAIILENLNILVRKALKQNSETPHSSSGMDIALISIDKREGKIYFAGAKRPLYIFNNGEFTKIGGDSRSIGGFQLESIRKFTRNEVPAEKYLTLYIFSDGFTDQLNGEDRKFGVALLKDMLLELHEQPMEMQKEQLLKAHFKHRGEREQIDDITVIGFVVS